MSIVADDTLSEIVSLIDENKDLLSYRRAAQCMIGRQLQEHGPIRHRRMTIDSAASFSSPASERPSNLPALAPLGRMALQGFLEIGLPSSAILREAEDIQSSEIRTPRPKIAIRGNFDAPAARWRLTVEYSNPQGEAAA